MNKQRLGAITLGLLLALGAWASPEALRTERFEIKAQPLSSALRAYAEQTGDQVVFFSEIGKGMQCTAVVGEFTREEALGRLLQSTGLKFERLNAKTVAITDAIAKAQADHGLTRVRGAGDEQRVSIAQADAAAGAAKDGVSTTEEASTKSDSPNDKAGLEEIIVTAQKRSERLQDVPAAVTALSGESLAQIGATRLQDYFAKIPGVNLEDQSFTVGGPKITIRGINTGQSNPTVGIYIDGSPFGASNIYGAAYIPDLDPMDLERVEVLKGPQGTLYGAGAMGGLLKYVTVAPDPGRRYGRVQMDGAAIDGGGVGGGIRGAFNLPLSETVALRVSGLFREEPGYIDNPATGETEVNDIRVKGGRLALAWLPNSDLTVRLSALAQRQEFGNEAAVDFSPTTFSPLYGGWTQVRPPGTGESAVTVKNFSLEVENDFHWATLTSATSFNNFKGAWYRDFSSLFGPTVDFFYNVQNGGDVNDDVINVRKFAQELRLSSPTTNRLAWQLGLFYTREHITEDVTLYPIDQITGARLPVAPLAVLTLDEPYREQAAFGNITYKLTSALDVTAGLRYARNQQTLDQTVTGLFAAPPKHATSEDSSTTFLLSPSYHLSPDSMIYVRAASGYRPGGPNIGVNRNGGVGPATFKPDTLISYELGYKSQLFDRRLSLDLAAYHIDWKDIQLGQTVNGLFFYGNASEATSKGIEATALWRPVRGLEINANVTYSIAELATALPVTTGAFGPEGSDLPGSKRWSGALAVDYQWSLARDWTALAGASYRSIGETAGLFPQIGAERLFLPSYEVIDLRIGAMTREWSVMLLAKNVDNVMGQLGSGIYGPVLRVSTIQPRALALSISRSF